MLSMSWFSVSTKNLDRIYAGWGDREKRIRGKAECEYEPWQYAEQKPNGLTMQECHTAQQQGTPCTSNWMCSNATGALETRLGRELNAKEDLGS